jgi:NADH-quinone oxidoreductase subunit J
MLSETASLVFYVVAVVMIFSAIMVVALRNIFHSALFLILCLFSVAGIFILCEAEFLAGVQVLIYVGGVAVLMIFAIMLTAKLSSESVRQLNEQKLIGALVAICFLLITVATVTWTLRFEGNFPLAENPHVDGSTSHTLGNLLLTDFVLPFELVSVLLLAALIGAVVLAKKDGK